MKIRSITNANEPIEGVYPEDSSQTRFPSLRMPGVVQDKPVRLFFLPEAVEQIFRFIHWDERTAQNRVEQAGIMYGMTYKAPTPAEESVSVGREIRDESTGVVQRGLQTETYGSQARMSPLGTAYQTLLTSRFTWSVVHGIIPSQTKECSPVRIDISAHEWQRMAMELDRFNAARVQQGEMEMQQVGWFHTHPNQLEPYYSDLDVTLQRMQASNMDRYGVVFNPHRRIFAVYAGPDSRPDQGVLLLNEEQVQRYNMQSVEVLDPSLNAGEPIVKLKKRSPLVRLVNDVMDRFSRDPFFTSEDALGWSFDPFVARMRSYKGGRWIPYEPKDSILMSSVDGLRTLRNAFGQNVDVDILSIWRRGRAEGFHLIPIMAWCRASAQPKDIINDELQTQKCCVVRFVRHTDLDHAVAEQQNHPERLGGMMLVLITESSEVFTIQ